MSWRKRKEIIVLTSLLIFSLGLILLLISRFYFSTEPWITVCGILGGYLTTAVVVNIFHRSFLKPSEDETRKNELKTLLDERINEVLGNSAKYGFSGFRLEMDYRGLFRGLKKGDTLLWLDTYCPGHELWGDELRSAISRGVKIRILVMSPNSTYARDRANELGGTYTPERFENEIRSFKDGLEIILRETVNEPGKLEILEYKDRPGLPIYLVIGENTPDYAYSSFFLGKPTMVDFPHMKWTVAENSMISFFRDYIEKKWKRNLPNTAVDPTVK